MVLAALAQLLVVTLWEATSAVTYSDVRGAPFDVEIDARALRIAGEHALLLSGDIHYARATAEDQERALSLLKADGLNTVQTYAFWNLHEPEPGRLVWGEADGEPRANVTAFLDRAAAAGLFVSLRIGPFVCGEWSYGGIPAWINNVPDMGIRQHNAAWESAVRTFVLEFFVRVEPYLARNGGPIIMLQLENELGVADPNSAYVQYIADLAQSLNSSLPFLWCEGISEDLFDFKGPAPFVPALNGNDCAESTAQMDSTSGAYPLLWTENEGWYHPWGTDPIDGGLGSTAGTVENPNRSPEELAYAVARWVARGGAFMNYYMYFGGQHVGGTAAAGVLNSYADGVNIHSDGQPNEPKRSHTARLHKLVMAHERAIMAVQRPIVGDALERLETSGQWVNSTEQLAFVFHADGDEFVMLENKASKVKASQGNSSCSAASFPVVLGRQRYRGLIPGPMDATTDESCRQACCDAGVLCEVYQWWAEPSVPPQCWLGAAKRKPEPAPSTGSVSHSRDSSPTGVTVRFRGRTYVLPYRSVTVLNPSGDIAYNTAEVDTEGLATTRSMTKIDHNLAWSCWRELPLMMPRHNDNDSVLATKPLEQLNLTKDATEYLLYQANVDLDGASGKQELEVQSRIANALVIFWDGELVGAVHDAQHSYGGKVLSTSVDLPSSRGMLSLLSTSLGMHSHVHTAMDYKGIVGKVTLAGKDVTTPAGGWSHGVGALGEQWHVWRNQSIPWTSCSTAGNTSSLTWLRTQFTLRSPLSEPYETVLLDLSGMGRGHFYLNGHNLGRYWLITGPGGQPTQRYYHLPTALLNFDHGINTLVLGEELGATDISQPRVVFSNMLDPQHLRETLI